MLGIAALAVAAHALPVDGARRVASSGFQIPVEFLDFKQNQELLRLRRFHPSAENL